ncbi:spore germination protein [Papillibacter cinnamivorans]|nr:spore germination protein [Papillibacter cinnamivorans]
MFRENLKKITYWMVKRQLVANDEVIGERPPVQEENLSGNLKENIARIREEMGNSADLVVREFSCGSGRGMPVALVYVDGMANAKILNESAIKPLMFGTGLKNDACRHGKCTLADLKEKLLSIAEVNTLQTLDSLLQGILSGDTALLADESREALMLTSKGFEKRSVTEPLSEAVIRGPREGFTESIRTNTSLLRRKIKNPALTIESMTIGEKTRTAVCFAYIRGVANEELISSIRDRLKAVRTDAVLDSGCLEEYIEDAPFSIFPTLGYTEKPDVAAAKILEGRAAILVDGSPFALTAPLLFIEGFQSAEDYYFRSYYMSLVRVLRYISYIITIFAPALYVAITTFHQELLPTDLLFTMAAAREGIPFPAVEEALIMLITFEILREAGVRLPRPVGQALSIVGALVIGDAAVSAGLIGAPMVIVIAITAVSVFLTPNLANTAAILRLIFLFLAGFMGGYGITIGFIGVLIHLGSLKSFGFPYFAPFAPYRSADMKDAVIRSPLWMLATRPEKMARRDRKRLDFFVPPADGTKNEQGE